MVKRTVKQVGIITTEIASKHKILELANRPIVQSLDFYVHIAKHVKEFKTVENYNKAIENINAALINPEFTIYDDKRKSLRYYAKCDEYTCYVVNINLSNDCCYLATLYPISNKNLEKKKAESYIIKKQ